MWVALLQSVVKQEEDVVEREEVGVGEPDISNPSILLRLEYDIVLVIHDHK